MANSTPDFLKGINWALAQLSLGTPTQSEHHHADLVEFYRPWHHLINSRSQSAPAKTLPPTLSANRRAQLLRVRGILIDAYHFHEQANFDKEQS